MRELPEIIVSLTSWSKRIDTVNQAVESILNQDYKPDKVILWLATEEFPNKENDLPQQLLDLQNRGLTIDWCEDLKSYKKLIPTLRKYPKAVIVTADDDIKYSNTWLSKLVKSYKQFPDDIHCHRVTKFWFNEDHFEIKPGGDAYYLIPSYLNKLSGGAGTLYPPHCFYKDIQDTQLALKLAPTNDDQWFWVQAILNHRKVRVIEDKESSLNYIFGTQKNGLKHINDGEQNLFWKDFWRLMNYYSEAYNLLVAEDFLLNKRNKSKYAEHKEYLKTWYRKRKGHENADLDNPITFNDKIQYLKLNYSTPIKTRLTDKYLVRQWVADKIGETYLPKLLGVYENVEDIDFDQLPNRFVIKCNHGSSMNILVTNKEYLDINKVKGKLNLWLQTNFAYKFGYELHYKYIKPRVVIEEYLGDNIQDYKFMCTNGYPRFIWVDSDRYIKHKRNVFDLDWNKLDVIIGNYEQVEYIPKPSTLEEMKNLTKILCQGFEQVRVDFYTIRDKVYFGEMTFTSTSGTDKITPESFDLELSSSISLPKYKYDIDTGEFFIDQPSILPKESVLYRQSTENDLVSIVIPVYNSAVYLEDSISDLINQTYKNIEIILVDDCSTDDSAKIIQNWAQKDNRVKLIRHSKQQYAGIARNTGMKSAKGEYIIFLDSDDRFETYLIEKSLNKIKSTQADFVVFKYKRVDVKTNITSTRNGCDTNILNENKTIRLTDYPESVFTGTALAPWNKLYRRSFIDKYNLKFQGTRSGNDVLFTCTANYCAKSIAYLPEALLTYRIYLPGSLTSTRDKSKTCCIEIYGALKEFLINHNDFDKYKISWERAFRSSLKWLFGVISNKEELIAKIVEAGYRSVLPSPYQTLSYRIPIIKENLIKVVKYTSQLVPSISILIPQEEVLGKDDLSLKTLCGSYSHIYRWAKAAQLNKLPKQYSIISEKKFNLEEDNLVCLLLHDYPELLSQAS